MHCGKEWRRDDENDSFVKRDDKKHGDLVRIHVCYEWRTGRKSNEHGILALGIGDFCSIAVLFLHDGSP